MNKPTLNKLVTLTPTISKKKAVCKKPVDTSWHDRFIEVFSMTPCIASAARAVDVGRRTVYDHMARFPDFRARCTDARDEAIESLEADAFVQARNNTTLMIFLLKAHKPHIYRDRYEVSEIKRLSDEELIARVTGYLQAKV